MNILLIIVIVLANNSFAGKDSPQKATLAEFDWNSYLIDTQDHSFASRATTDHQIQPVIDTNLQHNEKQAQTQVTIEKDVKEKRKKANKKYDSNTWLKEKAAFQRLTPEQKRFKRIKSKSRQQKYSNKLQDQTGFSSKHNQRLNEYRILEQKGEANQDQLRYLNESRKEAQQYQITYKAKRIAKGLPLKNE